MYIPFCRRGGLKTGLGNLFIKQANLQMIVPRREVSAGKEGEYGNRPAMKSGETGRSQRGPEPACLRFRAQAASSVP